MIEPVTTFRDPQGAPLRRWAVHAGMLITDVKYDAASGCLDVVVEEPKAEAPAEDAYEPDSCPKCGQDLNDTRHGDAHHYTGGCPDA